MFFFLLAWFVNLKIVEDERGCLTKHDGDHNVVEKIRVLDKRHVGQFESFFRKWVKLGKTAVWSFINNNEKDTLE